MIVQSRRALEGQTFRTCWHEAGHAVAGWLLGRTIERIEILTHRKRQPGCVAGRVHYGEGEVTNRHEAEDEICISFAGEAALRTAWALEVFDEINLGLPEGPARAMTVDEMAVVPNGSSPASALAQYGYGPCYVESLFPGQGRSIPGAVGTPAAPLSARRAPGTTAPRSRT